MKTILKVLFVLAMAVTSFWTFAVKDAAAFQRPGMARVFLWHFPPSVLGTFLMMFGAYFAVRMYLRVEMKSPLVWRIGPETDSAVQARFDLKSLACTELGSIFFVLTMLTGIIFSKLQWSEWWSWDPRQTSFLIVLLLYGAYFALRIAYPDPEKQRAYSGAYLLTAFLPSMFLTFVFPRIPYIKNLSIHPTDSITGGDIKGEYAQCLMAMLFLFAIFTVYLYGLRVRSGLVELELEKNDGSMEDFGSDPTPTGVVRRISVSD